VPAVLAVIATKLLVPIVVWHTLLRWQLRSEKEAPGWWWWWQVTFSLYLAPGQVTMTYTILPDTWQCQQQCLLPLRTGTQ
jgi:hypothetical protein